MQQRSGISSKSKGLNGTKRVPSDKSISHRSLILGSQATGKVRITHLLEAEDVLATKEALRLLGVPIDKESDGTWVVQGVGIGGLQGPKRALDMGNTGTGTRLVMGLVATYPFATSFTGDKSLCSRPMGRVLNPLKSTGMRVVSSEEGDRLPITIEGGDKTQIKPIDYQLPVPSAQVKSAILLAGLNIAGTTIVRERHATRDHTERMLKGLGAKIETTIAPDGTRIIALEGKPHLVAKDIDVPGDPSSAAFPIVAALITPHSHLLITDVCMNEERIGLYTTLQEMGANLQIKNERICAGERIADIEVKTSLLRGIDVPAERAPSMIDEYPILSIAAAVAQGATRMCGLAELRVKESDRLEVMLQGLLACGVNAFIEGDDLIVMGGIVPGGATIVTHMDHRIAMSFLVLGFVAEQPVTVDDVSMIQTSFPDFLVFMKQLGAVLEFRTQ